MPLATNMALSVTDVRSNLRQFIDDVISRGPRSLKRHRDVVFAISAEHLQIALDFVRLKMTCEQEPDGSFTGGLEQVGLVANAPSPAELKRRLADDLAVYAEEYLQNFDMYYHAPNRRQHLPIVLRALATEADDLPGLIDAE